MIDTLDLRHVLEHTRDRWDDLRGERVFITGATGFVGSWLVASFLHANRELCLRARATILSRDLRAARARLDQLRAGPDVDLVGGDGGDFAFPSGRFRCVIHAATQRAFTPDAARPLGLIATDARMTQRVLDFACGSDTERMLFTSSGAIYGRQPPAIAALNEEFAGAPLPTDADAAYGHSKRLSEVMCAQYARATGINVSIARLFAFIGPLLPLDEGYAAGNFIGDALAGRTIRIGGDGTPLRTYLYAADLAIWLWTILLAGRSGRAYNTGGADPLSIGELARLVAREAPPGVGIDIALSPQSGAVPTRYVPDTQRAQIELGLRSHIPVHEALRRTLRWHRDRSSRAQRSIATR